MTNPLDYTIQDPDAMRYALMQDSSYRGGGAVRMADGGILDGHPIFQTAQVPFAEYRHSIGMNHGGMHFDEGGQVSLDQILFELGRAQHPNSPVMQATPRGAVQDFIGTVGGYMDKAGKFVSEAIEPIAKTHPIKTGLVNTIVADQLKNAGTALQDYTGTVRETDDNNPVRGVISKDWRNLTTSREPILDPRVLDIAQFVTPVVSGATKLLGAGAKAAAPFASKVDDMVRELHASGAMPQPGLSIKDVSNNLVDHYHGSDTKALSVLDPAASAERRSNGSSIWFKTNEAEASEYPKKKSGSVYTAPLDTSGFAKVDANFTSNKAIHPDAVIYHSNGEITPVSSLGERVTTDDIAAYSKSKGDPGVRILNVGDKGSGRVRSESPYGESVAVHSPVKTTAERSLADIDQPKYYDTPEFKNWFKDSPVIDESGSPLTVYHGGAGDVTEFDASRGKKTAANTTGASEGFNSFTDNPSLASSYAQRAGRKGANVVPAHLSMQNPYVIENAQSHWRALPAPAEMTYFDPKYRQNTTVQKGDMIDINQLARWAKDNGYDGLVVKNVSDPAYEKDRKLGLTNTYVTFKPNQVKSIFNSGEWNPNDPHISKARGGKVSLDQMRHELTKAK